MGIVNLSSRIVIPCRFAYVNCWNPNTQFGGVQKYSLSALIPKNDTATVELIKQTIEYVKEKSLQKWGGKVPTNLKYPLHDGDEEKSENPIYRNCYYLNTKCKDQPQVVDINVQPILNQTEVYSGCYGNVSVVFYGYNHNGSKGIGVWLGNIQKIKDGEPFGSRICAKDEFHSLKECNFLQ